MSFSDLRESRKTKSYVNKIPSVEAVANNEQITASLGVLPWDELYPSLPTATEIRTSDVSGRGVWATHQLRPGTLLLSVAPHAAVLSTDKLDSHCSCCFEAPPSGLKRCAKCHHVWYCDSACQTKDWSLHKRECIALQRWSASAPSADVSIPNDAVRCIARILWTSQKKGVNSLWSRQIQSMQSHRRDLPVSSAELHTRLAHALVQYLGLTSPQDLSEFNIHSAGDLLDLTSRFTTNSFALTDATLSPLGVSVSPLVALVNHSCQPNAVVVFPRASANPQAAEPLMQVVILGDISPGEEILTAYIDTTLPREFRRETLRATYHFDCQCQLCVRPPEVDPRESMRCPKLCGGVCALPTEEDPLTRCNQCRSAVVSTDEVLDATCVGQEALDKATAVQFQDPAKSFQLTSNLIPILTSAGVMPSSHPLLALTMLQKSFPLPSPLTQDALDDTIRIASKAVTGLLGIHPEGHPVVGIALAELGKLLAVDEPVPHRSERGAYPPSGPPRLQMAHDTLMRARASLMIGFGRVNEGGRVGKEVRNLIASLEKEIGVFKQGVKNVLQDMPKNQ
ncbi:SET domain-containing protein [Mucidula mucida]|nr:SET domain-containing protein [Mucidula mucida]